MKAEYLALVLLAGFVSVEASAHSALPREDMCAWTLITSFDDERNALSEAECEKFFDSLKIK
jgi:hypothetical protein